MQNLGLYEERVVVAFSKEGEAVAWLWPNMAVEHDPAYFGFRWGTVNEKVPTNASC